MSDSFSGFTAGDLVLSVYGDGEAPEGGTGPTAPYGDNQASPIVLEQVTTAGTLVSELDLPQTASVVNGVAENPISGEYGSSSEGELQLSADGRSLVIGGYDVNAAQFNTGGTAVYGTAALAQTYTVATGSYTLVPRVVADITADGTIDTSTALLGVFNTNNIRSVATVDGTSFYVSGQGVSGDTTQGLFLAADGAGSATAIDTSTDTRSVEISNGVLYLSRDSKQPKGTGTSNIDQYGSTLPTHATTPATLPGISQTVTLAAGNGNSVNNSSGTVHLSPEEFFFANSTTLYVADSGNPKEGGLGDGGLQKFSLVGGTWQLDYTLSAGLNLVSDTAKAGTTGLIGLTGTVTGNTVTLYATNTTIGDEDPTFLYGITDSLSATTLPTAESFQTLVTAAPDTSIRGVAFAPAAPCFAAGTRLDTPAGPVAVEALRPGDLVDTTIGPRPVRWVGHRRAHDARVIRVRAHALGHQSPRRDLFVSDDHALLVDGVLVPAGLLTNDAITAETRDGVTFFHVELDQHAILLAEGAPAESYLDTGNRARFGNCPLGYDPAIPAGEPCADLVLAGDRLDRARTALAVLAS